MPGNWQGMVLHRGHEELAIIIVMLQCECILLAGQLPSGCAPKLHVQSLQCLFLVYVTYTIIARNSQGLILLQRSAICELCTPYVSQCEILEIMSGKSVVK